MSDLMTCMPFEQLLNMIQNIQYLEYTEHIRQIRQRLRQFLTENLKHRSDLQQDRTASLHRISQHPIMQEAVSLN